MAKIAGSASIHARGKSRARASFRAKRADGFPPGPSAGAARGRAAEPTPGPDRARTTVVQGQAIFGDRVFSLQVAEACGQVG